jgi:hypothetical protein
MRSDASLAFVPIGAPMSLVGGAGLALPSPITIDLLGQGVGTAPQNIIGNVSTFGTDLGIGRYRAQLDVAIGTAAASGGACTLNLAMQGAPDQGAGGAYQPGAWQTLVETGPLTLAQLTTGQIIARFDWAAAFPANLRPRYVRLLAQIAAGLSFTAGTIAYAIVTTVRDDQQNRQAANNYVVA